jgi:hypothetical protein
LKLHHFVLVFAIITLSVIVITDIKTNNLEAIIENKEQIKRNINTAIDDGITELAEVDERNSISIDKNAAVNSFFMSLYSVFGVIEDKEAQEKLNFYVPVIAVTMENGYSIFYSDEYTGTDGYTYVAKRWSEKFPYYFEDEDFIYGFTLGNIVNLYDKNNLLGGGTSQYVYELDYHDIQTKDEFASFREERPGSILLNNENFDLVRKQTILDCLEASMAYYTSRHNKIAQQSGITYSFNLPAISEDEWAPFLNDVSMFVVFQGYPYGTGDGENYNRVAAAGAKVTKREAYFIEQKGWYLIYHKEDCPELKKEGIILWDEPLYDQLDCAKKGCYQCPVCFKNGIHAPDI